MQVKLVYQYGSRCDIPTLQNAFNCPLLPAQVVHLVRDPRAIATSRHSLNRRLNIMKSMAFTCNRLRNNADLGMLERPPWLEGRYKVGRRDQQDDVLFKTLEDKTVLRSEIPSGICAKLRTVAASNNRIHMPWSLYYCLFAPHICMVLFFAHIPFVVNHTINATPPERLQHGQPVCCPNVEDLSFLCIFPHIFQVTGDLLIALKEAQNLSYSIMITGRL